jgi:hypothetical protein
MLAQSKFRRAVEQPAPADPELGDLRFRALLSAADWAVLPPEVRERFSKRLSGGRTVVYLGTVREVRMNRCGKLLVQMLRLMGAPLPLFSDVGVPTVVSVTEDATSGGQIWSRMYCNRQGFPQVIHSAKRFSGPTGLEEHVGFGVTMALKVIASSNALAFASAGYAFRLGRWRIPIPALLSPGALTVQHEALSSDSFMFTMTLHHRWFGELVHQSAQYFDHEA